MRATIRDVSREAGVSIKTVSRVLNNERYVGAETTAYLVALGHRRIAHIAGPGDYATSAQRHAGYAAAGIAADADLVTVGDFDFASGARAAAMLLDRRDPPTAIFAASDEMAAGALTVAHARRLAVPGTLSIVGFGDDTLARFVWPALTTVRQPCARSRGTRQICCWRPGRRASGASSATNWWYGIRPGHLETDPLTWKQCRPAPPPRLPSASCLGGGVGERASTASIQRR